MKRWGFCHLQKLPIVSGEKLIKLLLNLGYEIVRQRGSHVRLRKQAEVGEHNITLDVLSYEEQLNEIKKVKRILYTPKSTPSAMLGFMKRRGLYKGTATAHQ